MSSSYAVDGEPPFFSNKERGLEESELFEVFWADLDFRTIGHAGSAR
jgi:hypothetical protein